jgi:hypothetical protein
VGANKQDKQPIYRIIEAGKPFMETSLKKPIIDGYILFGLQRKSVWCVAEST